MLIYLEWQRKIFRTYRLLFRLLKRFRACEIPVMMILRSCVSGISGVPQHGHGSHYYDPDVYILGISVISQKKLLLGCFSGDEDAKKCEQKGAVVVYPVVYL